MTIPLPEEDYHTVVGLRDRFAANGEEEQVAFCEKILDGLDRPDEN